MSENLNNFQKKAERIISESLKENGFHIMNRSFEDGSIYIKVDSMEIDIFGMVEFPDTQNRLDFYREYLHRGMEFYRGLDEDKEINNFTRCLIYYLKHPEYTDKISWKNPRSIWEWLKVYFLGASMDDADELERKDSSPS
jgi:hypothetical protein